MSGRRSPSRNVSPGRGLDVVDEVTRESVAIRTHRKRNTIAASDALTDLFVGRGVPGRVRSDNGPEFIATAVRDWIAAMGATTAFIEPGRPRDCRGPETGPGDRFPEAGLLREFRGELPNGEVFCSPGYPPPARRVVRSGRSSRASSLVTISIPSRIACSGAVSLVITLVEWSVPRRPSAMPGKVPPISAPKRMPRRSVSPSLSCRRARPRASG